MDKLTFERLQNLKDVKAKHKEDIRLCNSQLKAIHRICDHKYPDGTYAFKDGYCKICYDL